MKKTMSVAQAGRYLGMTRQGVWFAITYGAMKAKKKVVGDFVIWRIDVEEVERYKLKREKTA
jgi:hypothetical protein